MSNFLKQQVSSLQEPQPPLFSSLSKSSRICFSWLKFRLFFMLLKIVKKKSGKVKKDRKN